MAMAKGRRSLLAAAVFLLALAACTSTAGRLGPGTGHGWDLGRVRSDDIRVYEPSIRPDRVIAWRSPAAASDPPGRPHRRAQPDPWAQTVCCSARVGGFLIGASAAQR